MSSPHALRREYLTVPFEVKEIDSRKREFEGYSATWDLDLGGDIIERGAFARTLGRVRQGEKSIPLVDSHRYTSIFDAIGTLVAAEEDAKGLRSRWRVIDGVDGERVMDRLRSGVVRKKSIGYRTIRSEPGTVEREGKSVKVRRLKEVAWEETSLVLFPMNPAADVDMASVKCLLDAAARAGTLTTEQKDALRALLDAPPPEVPAGLLYVPLPSASPVEPAALAPDDPKRLRLESLLRDLTLSSLARSPGPHYVVRRTARPPAR